jgi:hypothetical protein
MRSAARTMMSDSKRPTSPINVNTVSNTPYMA